jgi:hypothetical protein
VDRRHQVFVSSTFLDLKDERAAIIATLLNMDAMPAGMELFPAGDDDAWTLIQQVIQESDYYLLVIGGRYGAIDDASNVSYTEKEFDYAMSLKKPVMAFLHGNPGAIALNKSEQDEEARTRLASFREKVETHKHVKYWESAKDLAGLVALSFPKLQRAHPAVGWVRGDVQTSSESLAELNELRKRLEENESRLAAVRKEPPPGTENLSRGKDKIKVSVQMLVSITDSGWTQHRPPTLVDVVATWDQIFAAVGPELLDEASQAAMRRKLNTWFASEAYEDAKRQSAEWIETNEVHVESQQIHSGAILDDDFDTMVLQLRALGLIVKSDRKRSVKDSGAYWTLTPYGDDQLTALRAIHRGNTQEEVPPSPSEVRL